MEKALDDVKLAVEEAQNLPAIDDVDIKEEYGGTE